VTTDLVILDLDVLTRPNLFSLYVKRYDAGVAVANDAVGNVLPGTNSTKFVFF